MFKSEEYEIPLCLKLSSITFSYALERYPETAKKVKMPKCPRVCNFKCCIVCVCVYKYCY